VRSSPQTNSRPNLLDIDFFVYSRATASAADLEEDPALNEDHWSYMDRFAEGMIARGPTFAADRSTWTGSIHIVGLPSAEAAHEFVENEPYNRAGLFEHHLIRRFKNLLGRTMWEAPGGSADPRFFVIGHLSDAPALPRERLIVHGELLTLDEQGPAGFVLALQAPARESVAALIGRDQGNDSDVEVLDWEFGGRR
jgi:uncharacterized protein